MAWPALAALFKGGAAAGGAGGAGGGGFMSMLGGLGGGGGKQGGGMMDKVSSFKSSDPGMNAPKNMTTMGIGAIQMLQGLQSKKKAESAFPSLVDSNQAAMLAELNQKRKSIDTGADFASALNYIDQTAAGTQGNIVRSTGGDVQGTITALTKSQTASDMAKNQAIAQGQEQQMQYTGMANALNNLIADRKMHLQLSRYQQKMTEWAQSMKEGKTNFIAGLSRSMNTPSLGGGQGSSPVASVGEVAKVDTKLDTTTQAPEKSIQKFEAPKGSSVDINSLLNALPISKK
jgi:hypothetical protein